MALATRNLYLVLKARDEASRVVRGFGRELSRAGRLAQAETLRNRAGLAAQRASYLAMTGASAAAVDGQKHLSRELRNQATALERSHRASVRFTNALHTASATLITVGSGLAIAGGAGLLFLKSAVDVAAEYERQVRLTSTQADVFKASLEEFAQVGIRVANSIAVPFEQIQPALYDILSSTNANLREAEILLEGFSKTAVAGQVSLAEASRGTIPILNAFNIPLEKVNDILDIQFQLVRKGVGTYGEFSKVFGRVTPSATRAGQNFQMVAAMLAFLTRNGLSAAMASTSAARALEAMSHPKSVEFMEDLGIKVRDAAGNFLPLNESLSNLRDHLNKLPKKERVGELVEIFKGAGGTIQARRFLEQVLLRPGELEEFTTFLGDMNTATGQFEMAYGTMADGVAAQTELMRNKWKVLQETVGRIVTPAFIAIIEGIQGVLDWFNKLSPGTKRVVVAILGVTSVLLVLAGLAVVVLGSFAALTAAITIAGSSFFILTGIVAGITTGFLLLGGAFFYLFQKSEWFRFFVKDVGESLMSFWKDAVLPVAQGIRDAWDQYMGPPLSRLWDVIENQIIPAASELHSVFMSQIIPAVREVGNWLKDHLAIAFEVVGKFIDGMLIPALKRAQKWYYEHKETIDPLIATLIEVSKQVAKVAIFIGTFLAAILAGPIIGLIIGFVGLIALMIAGFINTIETVKRVIAWFKSWGDSAEKVKGVVKTAMTNAVAFIKTIPDKIKGLFANAGQFLLNAGKQIIQGLVDGIRSKIPSIGDIMGKAMNLLKGFVPGSPAKWGPLAGAGSMFNSGKELVRQFNAGISAMQAPQSREGRRLALNAAGSTLQAPSAATRTITNNITVHTQQIDPRRESAQLGFLLAGRS
jgi:TP901 family phage tail tape measure protein